MATSLIRVMSLDLKNNLVSRFFVTPICRPLLQTPILTSFLIHFGPISSTLALHLDHPSDILTLRQMSRG